jgi:hypothetical protein
MKTNVKVNNLEILKKEKNNSNNNYSKVSSNRLKAKTASTEINVIG